jgi:dihydroflavonol-4-reductase
MTRVLVRGAGGFVGRHLVPRLVAAGHDVAIAGRAVAGRRVGHTIVGDIGADTDWHRAPEGYDTVIHLAAQVPARGIGAGDYATVNDRGTEQLVSQAQATGVTRIILLSSISGRLLLGRRRCAARMRSRRPERRLVNRAGPRHRIERMRLEVSSV